MEGEWVPPPGAHLVLYRIAQEALNNVAKHARAHRATLRLSREPGRVRLVIRDDGQGFDREGVAGHGASERGVGLLGMRERVASLEGRLRVQSRPGQGTRLSLEIPL